MSSIVLLVDAEQEVRAIIERQLDPAHSTLVHVTDVEQAQKVVKEQAPSLVVVNVDIAKGWPLCTSLKRSYATIPVIVVSFRLGKEVFNNHQKLDTRADAYHRLPEELEGLEISLGYFSSHRSETGHDDEESSPSRPRPRKVGARVAVPTGVVQRLETTVAEQARALEDARRQIEALEVERDAVADKNRRQMLELMAVSPSSGYEGGDAAALKERVTVLEGEVLMSSRREVELNEAKAALAAASATLATKITENDKLAYERSALEVSFKQALLELEETRNAGERARQMLEAQVLALRAEKAAVVQRQTELEEAVRSAQAGGGQANEALEAAREAARKEAAESAQQLAQASVQVTSLSAELTQAHQARMQAEKEKRAAEDRAQALEHKAREIEARAEAAENAWNALNARVSDIQSVIAAKQAEIDQLAIDKKSVEQALTTSRKLMREYAADAARKAEELKAAGERVKELEARQVSDFAAKEELTQALEFEKSLVESHERELAELKARTVFTPEQLAAREAELEAAHTRARGVDAAERAALASHVATVHGRFEALVAYARALEARLVGAEGKRSELESKLEALVAEVRAQALTGEVAPAMELPSAPTSAS